MLRPAIAAMLVASGVLADAQIVREPGWAMRPVGVLPAPDSPVTLEIATFTRGITTVRANVNVRPDWLNEHRIMLRFGSLLEDNAMLTFRLRQEPRPMPLPRPGITRAMPLPVTFRLVDGDPAPGYFAVGLKTPALVTIEEIVDLRGRTVYENLAAAENLWAALMTR
jgi:hypothetical protein